MRKMIFNETKNAISKEEYNKLLMQYSFEKLPKDRFLERDECLKNRFEWYQSFIKEGRKKLMSPNVMILDLFLLQ